MENIIAFQILQYSTSTIRPICCLENFLLHKFWEEVHRFPLGYEEAKKKMAACFLHSSETSNVRLVMCLFDVVFETDQFLKKS